MSSRPALSWSKKITKCGRGEALTRKVVLNPLLWNVSFNCCECIKVGKVESSLEVKSRGSFYKMYKRV